MVNIIEPANMMGERCVPFLYIGISADVDVGIPERRLELERKVQQELTVIESNVYSVISSGPASGRNIYILAEIPTAEVWDSINRHVQSMKEMLVKEKYINDPGFDLSITVDAGDPEQRIREMEGQEV